MQVSYSEDIVEMGDASPISIRKLRDACENRCEWPPASFGVNRGRSPFWHAGVQAVWLAVPQASRLPCLGAGKKPQGRRDACGTASG